MDSFSFEWDAGKDRENFRKHGVRFDEAKTVFYDEGAVEFYDDQHSEWEDRFLLLGFSVKGRMLLVCHCVKGRSKTIRLISARKATKKERVHYTRRK